MADSTRSQPGDSAEWEALAEERFNGRDCGVKFSNAPHKQSAYAHLPMRGITASKSSTRTSSQGIGGVYIEVGKETQKRSAIALWPEGKFKAVKVKSALPCGNGAVSPVSKTKAHCQSAYSDLPLSGLGLEGSDPRNTWKLTATEKRTLAARPLRYTLPEVDTAIARQVAA